MAQVAGITSQAAEPHLFAQRGEDKAFHLSLCLAPRRHVTLSLGQRPRVYRGPNATAESAIHHQSEFDRLARLKRAFSPYLHGNSNSWGAASASRLNASP